MKKKKSKWRLATAILLDILKKIMNSSAYSWLFAGAGKNMDIYLILKILRPDSRAKKDGVQRWWQDATRVHSSSYLFCMPLLRVLLLYNVKIKLHWTSRLEEVNTFLFLSGFFNSTHYQETYNLTLNEASSKICRLSKKNIKQIKG